MKTLVIVVGLAVAIILAVDVTANIWTARFRERYEAEKADLIRRARAERSGVFDAAALNSLPPPVRRYLEVTRSVGKPRPQVAFLKQTGALRTAADRPWVPFEAEQVTGDNYYFRPGVLIVADQSLLEN